ncbi:hypothetical protein SMNM65_07190 [Streptococcus mitis]|uniref:Rib domain-containing protein n=1 Tax=Streptococcus mitis TaxID=28037 RepID=A0A7G1IUN0_STRMT|nr:hypothetical protein SMNM65_07190 [Streptococcus mitis]
MKQRKNADTNDNMKNMLKSDVVGTTNYKFGAKYPRGRFTNNPSETEKLSYTPTFTHEVFDVEANNDPRTQKNRVEVNNGEKLSATQAASAVVKTSNSPALPAGTTFEWVKSATDGTVLTDAEKNVTEFGEITRYVKVTLPKVSETGPNANRVQPYKIIPVTLKVNETVKPTVQMDGRRLTTNAEDNKFVIFRGATFNPTFTVNDNSGTTTYLKASGLPSGREIVKNTAMNNGTTVQISGDDAKTENKALGTYEGSIVVRDARGNNETYKFKYALVDVEVKNTPETVNKGTKLFVPGKAGESKNSHNYVKAVVSPNTDGSDVYYPGDMNFKWSKNNAEITNETVFNTPGAITYNAVVKFPNAKSDKNNVDIDGDGRNENVTIYAPDKVEKTVTFKVKPTAPEVVAKADGGVTISNTNETNVNKIQVTYTPSPTIATLTETDQDTFVEHPTTQLTASKNAQNKWSITEGAKDGISIDATSGAITINDATVKDGSQVVAKAITSDSVESAENRATAQDGDKTKPTVGLGNTLVQTGKQITLNLNVSDSGVGVDDSKVEVKNLPAGWQYNRANQTITGSIATASKTDIKVLVRDKKGNKTVKTVSLAAIQPKPIYAIKDGTIDNVGTPSNFVEMPAGVTSPSVSWKDGQPTTATAETTNKTVTVNVADYTATEVDVPVTVYPKVTLRKVDDKEVTEYHEVVGQPLTSAIWKSENAKVSPVKPDFYVAFDGEKPDGTMVEFEGGTPSERSTIAGVTHKTIKVTYPNGAGSVTKEITFKTYGNKPNYPVGKNEFETVVGSPFEKKSARDYVIKASELDNPNGIYVGWGRTGNSANPVNTNQAKVGVRTETVNIWYGNAIEKERGDNANHWFTDQNVEVRLAVKPQAPTLTANQFQGKAGTKPEITVSKLPTANQLGQDATVTVELYQGGNRVASKELSRDEVTQGAGSVHFDATNYTSNLTLGEKVHAVVKVVGGSGNTAYDLSSANSNDVQVTPQKPTFDATAVTSTSRTLSGTLGGFDATNKVVKVHLNDEKNTVLSSANTGEVTITGDKWTATIPDTVKLRQSVSKNGETTKPSGITVENTVTGETVSTTSDEKEVTMGDYSVASTIAGSKHIDITVPHDAKRVELRFHNNQETGEKPNGITLVRGADGTWHTEATRADNTTVTDANGYVGTITATPSATNPAESVITIPLNEESNGKKLHLREEAANGDNTATYGKGLGLRVEYQPEAGQDPAAAGNWKVVNVTNTAPVLSHKGTEGSSETNRKVFPSRTSITKAMLEELVTVGDPEDNAADTNNKPYGTPTVEIVSGLTETPGTATAPGNYIVTLKATDSQGRESNELTLYVEVRKQSDEHDPQAKDPQQEVSHNQEADPEKSVDKTKLPAGTSLAWKDDHKPDTSHPGNQTGIVVVTYPDGTSEDVTVTVKVKEQKDEYQPELKDPQQEVSHNQEADPEKSVDKTKLPAGTSLAWKDDHKPDTSHPGNQTGIVVVTYPDGTSEDVTVTVKVKEQKDEYQPELKDPQQEVSHNQEADPEKSVDKTKLPAGTSLAWKDDHKPDTSHPGNQTGIVVVTYPDGTSEDVTVTVKVKEQKDEYQPELKDPQQEVSHNQEADPEKSVDKTKLPAGTSLAWKDDHKPDTSHPGNQTGIVVVTYPDGTSEDVTVTVKVKEQKDEYQPELKDPQQEVSHNQEADPEKSVDKTKLPAGTSLAWKDDHKPDTSHPGNQTGIVVVTYPDGTSEDVTVTVKVKEQKDEYQPELKDPQQEVSHNQEADPEKSVDKTKLPAGTSLAWKDDHKPDTSHPGNQTGIVVVTYPDGTSEDVTVTVKVKEQKDEYQPELKDPQQEVSHNQEADPEKSVDKTKLPAGTSLAWKDDHKPDTSHPGNQTGIVVVTYPDGTSEDVTVTVKVKEQKDEYQPELKDPQQEVSHNQEADPEKSVDKTKLPAGTSLAWKDDHKPDTSHPGNQTGIVVVTYPDGTSEDVTVTVKVKEQKDEYQPELKDPQQEVSHNQEADPEKSVDKTKLPAGTSLAWKDDHKPDTSHPGNQTGIVVVTYPDGTSEDVTVTVKVKEQKDEYQPELKDPQQEVSHNQEADPEKSVDKTKLPAGTSLAWKDDHKPDTSHPGNQTGIVVVTYPDGTSEDVTVTVKVKEQKDEYQPELKDPQQEVSHNQEADPEKSVDKTKLPAGTSLAWKDDHKPDTSHPGNQTGIVVVTYPDGTSEDVTVTVKVKEQKDEYQPELKDPQQEVSHNQEADPEKSVDKTKLPAGTSLAWKDDHKPDTSHPGNQTGIVVVTYPDGTSEDVTVTVKVKEQKDEYQPELKDPQQEVSHNQEADPEKSVDKTKLPAGTSLAWKDDHKPDTSHPGNQTGIVVVTYPDGTSEDVTVTVKVKEQKDEYQPELKDPQQEVSHNQEADPEKSVDKTKLPAGTSLAWKDDHKPDTSHPGNQTGIVVVTYPDGTSEDVTVTVKVKEQKDEYQPELKDPQQEVSHNQEADPEKSVDKTKLPAGTSLAWKDDHKPDTSHPGNQTGIVVVTYPDGTSEDVTVTVKVKEQKDEYQPELKDPQQEVSHNQEADPEKSVDKTKLPAGTSLAWKDDHKPDTSHPGNQTGIVVVTYPDGTSEDVTVTVKVKEQKDEYQPELKDPQQEVSHNQEADPEKSVDKTKLPAGTSLAWKDDHKPDTSHPGNQTGIVVVTYPDGTSEDVTVTVKVKEQKDEYQPELKDPQQEVSHNQEADPEKSVDKTKLPAGTSLAWKDDHKPDTSHPGNQTGIVVVTYPDGTSEDVTVTVKVKEQKDEYQPELKDPQQEVSHNQEADPEKSVDKTKLPAGTSLAWKDDHKPDTSHPGNQTGIVVVTYPDGTSEDVTVTVKVKEQKDEYQPELKDPQQEVSHNQEADPEKSVDKTKLPAGTSLAWKDDHKPDTSHPGNQTGIVVVTYPDGTSEDVTVTVKVKEQKDEYQPELKDPQQEVSHNQEADPEKSVDKTKLPAGTSLAWKDDHKPDTSHPGNQTGIVVVTYPDGTSEDVTVTVKVKEQKDEYQPELKDPQQEVSHNQEADPEKSVDKTKLPAGTSLAWKDDHKPDTSHPGNQTGIVVVTYPDGTSEDVTVTVKVKEQKDEYQPELKDPQQEVSHNQEADPEKSVDKTKLPAGTSLAWKDDHKPDTSHPGNQTGIVVVTYPDGTSEDVTVTVKVKEQKDEYQPELKDPQQEVSHNQEADPEKSVDKTKLPAGTSLAWKDDHKPDTSHPGNQTGIVVVTYPDGTSEDVTVTVKVKEQKDEYQPELKDPQQEVSHNQEADPEKSR